LSKNVIERS